MNAHRSTFASLLIFLLLAGVSYGQVSVASVPQQLRQAEPPPASATAAELETTGDDLHARKYFADALDYYQAANAKASSARLLNKIGMMNLLLMRADAARKDFERALKIDPNYADAYNNLGAVEYQDHRLKPAIKRYQQAIALNPEFATYHSNLGTAFMERKEFDKAAAEYARALQIDPDVFEHRGSAGISARFPSPVLAPANYIRSHRAPRLRRRRIWSRSGPRRLPPCGHSARQSRGHIAASPERQQYRRRRSRLPSRSGPPASGSSSWWRVCPC